MVPPLPPMLQGAKSKGRNDQRHSILNANTLEPYLDAPLQDFETLLQSSPTTTAT